MKKLLLFLLFVPIVSFGQMDYYVSAKGGLNVREAPNSKAKKVSTLSYGTFVSIESRTAIKLTLNDNNKRTGDPFKKGGYNVIPEKMSDGWIFAYNIIDTLIHKNVWDVY